MDTPGSQNSEPRTVDVSAADLWRVRGNLLACRRMLETDGHVAASRKQRIYDVIDPAVKACDRALTHRKTTIKVSTLGIRTLRTLAEKATALVHSSHHMPIDSRRQALACIRRAKVILDNLLQLKLFPDAA